MYPAKGRRQKHYRQKHHSMNDRGDRRARAGSNIGRRPRDRPGGRDATGKRAKHIRNALGHQFLVGIMAGIGHAIGDHRGEEGFNRAKGGDGEGRPHQLAN